MGYESEAPFGLAKASFKITVESSMDWISSQSTEIEKYITYTGGADEDPRISAVVASLVGHQNLDNPVDVESIAVVG